MRNAKHHEGLAHSPRITPPLPHKLRSKTMSDGNTGLPMAPVPSEDEMIGIKRIFDRAANAIVQASELSKTVAELQTKFDAMARDLDLVKDRNASLETALAEVRSQRDTAMDERDDTRRELNTLKSDYNHSLDVTESYKAQVADLQAKLEAMTKDRDSASAAWHSAEDEAASAKAKLSAIEKALGLPEAPPPEPMTDHKPDAQPVTITDHGNPPAQEHPTDPQQQTGSEPDTRHDPWPSPTPTEPWKHD